MINEFENIFTKEVKLRLPGELPFFMTLSGGIDSSIMAYFASKIETKFLKSIYLNSNKNPKEKFDKISELQLSKIVSNKLKTKHKIIKFNKKKILLDLIKKISKNSFEGCIDPNQLNFLTLSKYLKDSNYKVVLMSEGPDEFLGGYLCDIQQSYIDKIFLKKRKINKKLNIMKIIKSNKFNKLKNFNISFKPFKTRVVHDMAPDSFLRNIFKNYKENEITSYNYLNKTFNKFHNKLSYPQLRALNYANKTIPDMISLRKDKSMMLHSVEPRFPFLAKNIVEFFISMPDNYRFNGKQNLGKIFLRNFFKRKINKEYYKFNKFGMGNNVWNIYKNLFTNLNLKKKLTNSKLFEKSIFKNNAISEILKSNVKKENLWSAYILSEIYDELLKINKLKMKNKLIKNTF